MWTFNTTTGVLSRDGASAGVGYSGEGKGFNNPALESVAGVGPLPRGRYTIGAFFDDLSRPARWASSRALFPAYAGKGPEVAVLLAAPGSETFGRGGFMIHGDNAALDNTGSHGCIVLPHPLRVLIAESGDTDLEVI